MTDERLPLSGRSGSPERDAAEDAVSACAHRIRLAMAEGADASPGARRAAQAEVLREALASVPPRERNLFIERVEALVPGFEGGRVLTLESGGPDDLARGEPVQVREVAEPEFLARQLVLRAGERQHAERCEIGRRLASAGLASPAGASDGDAGVSPAARARLAEVLGLEASEGAPGGRVLEVCVDLLEQFATVERVAQATWQQMAPESAGPGREGVRAAVRRYVASGDPMDLEAAREEISAARQLTAALLASIAHAGVEVQRVLEGLQPVEIERAARAEKKWNQSVDQACWRKYKELAGKLDGSDVEDRVIRAMAAFAGGLAPTSRRER